MNHFHDNYQKVQIETNDPIKLVVMLYEGAINFLEQAKRRLDENQIAEKGILINKVVAIVSELQSSLNLKEGREVAGSLDRLYTYMINRLVEANANNDTAILNEIINHLRTLKSAWSNLAEKGSQAAAETVQASQAAAEAIQAPQRAAKAEPVAQRAVPAYSSDSYKESNPIELVG